MVRGEVAVAAFLARSAPSPAETVSGFRAGEISAPINRGGYYRGWMSPSVFDNADGRRHVEAN